MLEKRGNDGKILLCPSLLAADFSDLRGSIAKVEGTMDCLHLDIMDGHFVPNISFGPDLIKQIRPLSKAVFDVHLMVSQPENWVEAMAKAGADTFVFHPEAVVHGHRLLMEIRRLGMSPGIALNPTTSLAVVEEYLPWIDLLLIMTVNPGFGGQAFIEGLEDKMRRARQLLDRVNPGCHIEVDGGINGQNLPRLREVGVDMFVMGSACFREADPAAFLRSLR